MEIKQKAKCLIDRANGRPFVFTGRIRFKDEKESKDLKCCFCGLDDYQRLSSDQNFDDTVFFYFTSYDDVVDVVDGKEDFYLEDIVLSGCKYI